MTDNLKNDISKYLFSLKRLRSECKIAPTIVDFSPPFMYNLFYSETANQPNPQFQHSIMTPATILLPLPSTSTR